MLYKELVFDFFGVVCSEVSPFWFEEYLSENSKEMNQKYLRPADLGEISQEELFKELSKLSGQPANAIERDWEGRAQFNVAVLDLVRELKEQYKIGLLSNSMAPLFHTLSDQVNASELFDGIVISSEIGHAKPEPEAFQAIIAKLGFSPEECLMIDDNQVNVDGARAIGMPGYRFVSVQEFTGYIKEVSSDKPGGR
jgi:HAD superfamily hydrolase (TIGR01509 family)